MKSYESFTYTPKVAFTRCNIYTSCTVIVFLRLIQVYVYEIPATSIHCYLLFINQVNCLLSVHRFWVTESFFPTPPQRGDVGNQGSHCIYSLRSKQNFSNSFPPLHQNPTEATVAAHLPTLTGRIWQSATLDKFCNRTTTRT